MAVEMLLMLPVMLLILVAGVEFGMIMSTSQRLSAATAHGARVASQGGDEEQVERAVRDALGRGFDQARVVATLRNEFGDLLETGDTVEVRVELPATAAAPDVLGWIGFRLEDETLSARTVMRKE